MKLPEFKNKKYSALNNQEKIAFIERVCMDISPYLNELGRGNKEALFINYWKENILNHLAPSNSEYMGHYFYSEDLKLCVFDKHSSMTSIALNIPEVLLFVFNAVNSIPTRSNLIDRLIAGETILEIEDNGIEKSDILKTSPLKKKTGRPANPNSLSQRVKRGEITRYEAFQKKSIQPSEDAL